MVLQAALAVLALLGTPDAVHLDYQVFVNIHSDGTVTERTVTAVIPLTGRGVQQYSSMRVSFRSHMEEVEILQAHVSHWRGGRGTSQASIATGPHSILTRTNRLESSLRETMITFPGVEIGDTVFVEIERTIDELPLSPVYSYTFSPVMKDSVAASSLRIVNDSGMQLYSTDQRDSFNFPASSPFPTHPLAAWSSHRISIATGSPGELSADASITLDVQEHGNCPELDEIIQQSGREPGALRLWVAGNINYIGAEAGVWPGWSPRTPEETIQEGSGVCRDRAVLLMWLLRKAGYQAYPALISTSGETPSVVDARSFDHMITVYRETGNSDWLLLDPTPGGIPENAGISFGLRGSSYLPITPLGDHLYSIPVLGWDDTLSISLSGNLDTGENTISGTLEAVSAGAPLELITTLYKQSNPAVIEEMFRRFFGAVSCDSVLFDGERLVMNGTWKCLSLNNAILLPGLRDVSLPGTRIASMLLPDPPDSFLIDAPAVENLRLSLSFPGSPDSLPEPVNTPGYTCSVTYERDSLILTETADVTDANEHILESLLLRSGTSPRTVVLR